MGLLRLRDALWNYPYYLFIGELSVFGKLVNFYVGTRPFSYVLTTLILSGIGAALLFTQLQVILGFNSNDYIEGVIVGTDASGQLRGPQTLNPLQITNPQLDKDIMALVYEPLIEVDQTGEVTPILAERFSIADEDNRVFRFKLRESVTWHDGTPFTSADVEATFNLIKEFGAAGGLDIYAAEAATNIELEVIDEYVVSFEVNGETLPNFYELITFKIVPAHLIDQYRDAVLTGFYTGVQTLTTVGTGPFRLTFVGTDRVELTANENYFLGTPKITNFKFKLLRDQEQALRAIRSGEIHGITNVTSDFLNKAELTPSVSVVQSNIINTQYWAIYLNLADEGPEILQSSEIRQALSQSINRDLLINTVFEQAEPALGPIPKISEFYSEEQRQRGYNPEAAEKLFADEGWEKKTIEVAGENKSILHKDDSALRLSLKYVNNPDRQKLAELIRADLLDLGVLLELEPVSPQELANTRINPEAFEMLLLGVSTFVDPDRFEFFHSSQSPAEGGNNISSYESSQKTSVIDEDKREVVRISLSDRILDEARKLTDTSERKELYVEFQGLLREDNPVLFLYHPSISIALNNRVKNVELDSVRTLEDRFKNVHNWEINYE